MLGADNIHAADLLGFSDPYVAVFWEDKMVTREPNLAWCRTLTLTLPPSNPNPNLPTLT